MSGVVQFARADHQPFEVEIGANQRGANQSGTGQRGTGQRGTGQRGTGQRGAGQRGAGQRGAGQSGADETGADQSRSLSEHCCSRMAVGIGAAVALAILTALTTYRPTISTPPAFELAMVPERPSVSPPVPPEPARPPVRFANPFDRTEVFEFPPGTRRAEARRKVAELLMERAQGRGQGSRRVAAVRGAGETSR